MLLFLGMKALPKKLLALTLIGIAVTSLFSVQPAQAYTVRLQQMGSNVVATGSGPINLTGLTLRGNFFSNPVIAAQIGLIRTGPAAPGLLDGYRGCTGPASFGSGGFFNTTVGSGNPVGIGPIQFIFGGIPEPIITVPQGYVSGSALSSSATWNNATFASLGVIPGTYEWTWGTGTGLANQNFTLIIGGAGVPDGGTTVSLLGCALLGLAGLRRRFGC